MKFSLGVVHGEYVNGWFFDAWTDAIANDIVREKFNLSQVHSCRSGPDLVNGRGRMLKNFVEADDADALLVLDADMSFPPGRLIEMKECYESIRLSHGAKAQILGGLAFICGGDRLDPARMLPNIWFREPRSQLLVQALTYPPDRLLKIEATGGACVVIGREVATALQPHPYYNIELPNGDRLSEDLSFCVRAGLAGFDAYLHTSLTFDHAKSMLIGEAEYRQPRTPPPGATVSQFTETAPVASAQPGITPEEVSV